MYSFVFLQVQTFESMENEAENKLEHCKGSLYTRGKLSQHTRRTDKKRENGQKNKSRQNGQTKRKNKSQIKNGKKRGLSIGRKNGQKTRPKKTDKAKRKPDKKRMKQQDKTTGQTKSTNRTNTIFGPSNSINMPDKTK